MFFLRQLSNLPHLEISVDPNQYERLIAPVFKRLDVRSEELGVERETHVDIGKNESSVGLADENLQIQAASSNLCSI